MIKFILVQVCVLAVILDSCYGRVSLTWMQNRQGKTRLSKWYAPYDDDEKVRSSFITQTSPCLEVLTIVYRSDYAARSIA